MEIVKQYYKLALGLVFGGGSIAWEYKWEAVRGILYERGWVMLTEGLGETAAHYGTLIGLVGITAGLFIWAKQGSNKSLTSAVHTSRDWPIRELFIHIRPDYPARASSTVGRATFDDLDQRWISVGSEVLKQLSLGRLSASGRGFKGVRLLNAGPIRPDFWRTAKFTYWFLDRLGTGILHAKNESGEEYADIEVNGDEALKIWPIEPWPDFRKWDKKEQFELYEAACLWFNIEPRLPMPERALFKYQEWREMTFGGGLPVVSESVRQSISKAMKDESSVTPNTRIRKEVLIGLAEHDGYKPLFLYPYKRGET
jgi:hypothetical protein